MAYAAGVAVPAGPWAKTSVDARGKQSVVATAGPTNRRLVKSMLATWVLLRTRFTMRRTEGGFVTAVPIPHTEWVTDSSFTDDMLTAATRPQD